jgi:hypothetical protein
MLIYTMFALLTNRDETAGRGESALLSTDGREGGREENKWRGLQSVKK